MPNLPFTALPAFANELQKKYLLQTDFPINFPKHQKTTLSHTCRATWLHYNKHHVEAKRSTAKGKSSNIHTASLIDTDSECHSCFPIPASQRAANKSGLNQLMTMLTKQSANNKQTATLAKKSN